VLKNTNWPRFRFALFWQALAYNFRDKGLRMESWIKQYGHSLLIATGNAGKVREIAHEIAVVGLADRLRVLGLKDLPQRPAEPEEDRPTFIGNAQKKAQYYAAVTGMLTLADDSGLCVDALGGAPGVLSARYAGEPSNDAANNAKLLKALAQVPSDQRTARFECALALAIPETSLAVFTGRVAGIMIDQPRGEHGFGYDPLFFYPPWNCTTAEVPTARKAEISHRGAALRPALHWLHTVLS